MFAADGDVAFVAANFHLGAFAEDVALGVSAQNHRCLAAAVADGFYLDEIIGPREQVLAALEEVALKIGAQSVGKYGDAEVVSDFPQLKNLRAREELRLVDKHTVDGLLRAGEL